MKDIRADVIVCRDCEGVAVESASRFVCAANLAVAERGMFFVAIPGGRSPQATYLTLASPVFVELAPWDRTQIFFADERCVPPDHADSNYRLVKEHLLSRAPIPGRNVHRIRAELPPEEAASKYESTLRAVLGDQPRFDLILLGLGTDTHVASLFPHSPALTENDHPVASNYVDKLQAHRLTLTLPVLRAARSVLMLAMWEEKAQAVYDVLLGDVDLAAHPAQAVQPTHRPADVGYWTTPRQ